jgi:uncharacterized membrane protein YphA (DoxX/SURF4 family)
VCAEGKAVIEAFCREKLGPLTLRLALGSVCVYHGFLKIMAAGGTAWQPGLPAAWQAALAWGEFAAGLAILVGLHCRPAAAAVLALTVGTLLWWQGWGALRLPLRTLEPFVLLALLSLSLLFLGAGELSLDRRGRAKSPAAKPPRKAAA